MAMGVAPRDENLSAISAEAIGCLPGESRNPDLRVRDLNKLWTPAFAGGTGHTAHCRLFSREHVAK